MKLIDLPAHPGSCKSRKSTLTYFAYTKRVDIPAYVTVTKDHDHTKIMVQVNWKEHNLGFSLNLLSEVIQSAAESNGLTHYKIFHDPKGFVLVGSP